MALHWLVPMIVEGRSPRCLPFTATLLVAVFVIGRSLACPALTRSSVSCARIASFLEERHPILCSDEE